MVTAALIHVDLAVDKRLSLNQIIVDSILANVLRIVALSCVVGLQGEYREQFVPKR